MLVRQVRCGENALRANSPICQCADEVESYIRIKCYNLRVLSIVNIIVTYTIESLKSLNIV